MRKSPLSEEEQVRRLERVVRHPTRWQLRKLVGELRMMLDRLEPLVEKLEAQDEAMLEGLRLRVMKGGALMRRTKSKDAPNKTLDTLNKFGI